LGFAGNGNPAEKERTNFMKPEKINAAIETAIAFADWRDEPDYDYIRHDELRNFVSGRFPLKELERWPWIYKLEVDGENAVQIKYAWAGGKFYETFVATYSVEQQKYIKGDMREIAKLWRRMRSKLENAWVSELKSHEAPMNLPSTNNEGLAQMFQALAAVPTLVALLQEQANQISAVRAELKALQNNQHPPKGLPDGYVSPEEYAARKFVSIKEAAFLLHLSTKSIRRLIKRNILTSSKAVGVKRIPKEDIETYQKGTG
jgi:hypothetical protein